MHCRWAEAYKVWVKLSPEEQNARGVLIREVKEVTGVKQADSDVEDIKLDSAVESACQELRASHLWPSVSALKVSLARVYWQQYHVCSC